MIEKILKLLFPKKKEKREIISKEKYKELYRHITDFRGGYPL